MQMMKQWCRKPLILSALMVSSLLFAAEPAKASLVTYSFDGAVGEVGGVLFPTIGSGFMSGKVTVDSAALPGNGFYVNAVKGLSLKINNVEIAKYQSGGSLIMLQDSPPQGGLDRLTAFSSVTGTGPAISGVSPVSFFMSLTDPTGNAFSSDQVPMTPPGISSFAKNQWRLDFGGTGNYVTGSLAHLTAVPLPAGVVLFGIGLISLVGLGAGGLRNLRVPRA